LFAVLPFLFENPVHQFYINVQEQFLSLIPMGIQKYHTV